MGKKLRSLTIGGNVYNYIENEDGTTNIDGMKFKVNEDVRESLTGLGGFMRDIFKYVENVSVYEIVVLYIKVPARGELTGIYFKSEEESDYKLTSSGMFFTAVKNMLSREKIDYKTLNTLEEVYNNPEYDLNLFLENYDSPISVDDTGFLIDNKVVDYYKEIFTKDKESVDSVIDYLTDNNDENFYLKDLDISNIGLIINEPNPFGLDIELIFYDMDDKSYSSYYKYLIDELGRVPSKDEYDELLEKEKIDILHGYAVDLNNKLKNRVNIDNEYRNKRIDKMLITYDMDVKDLSNSNMNLHITYAFAKRMFNDNLFMFKN